MLACSHEHLKMIQHKKNSLTQGNFEINLNIDKTLVNIVRNFKLCCIVWSIFLRNIISYTKKTE
jgi:hypothetical protein